MRAACAAFPSGPCHLITPYEWSMDTSPHKVVKTERGRARLAELQAWSDSTPTHPHSHLLRLHLARIFASCGFPPSQPCGSWQSAGSWQRRVRHSPQTQKGDPRPVSQPRLVRTFAIEVTTAQLTSICRSPAYEKRALGALRGRSREDHAVMPIRTSVSDPINVSRQAVDRRCRPRPAGGHRRQPCPWQGGPATRMGP